MDKMAFIGNLFKSMFGGVPKEQKNPFNPSDAIYAEHKDLANKGKITDDDFAQSQEYTSKVINDDENSSNKMKYKPFDNTAFKDK
jgi:hypothetical protein